MVESDDVPVSGIVSDCYRLIAKPDGYTPVQLDRLISERSQPEHMSARRTMFTCYVAMRDDAVVGFIASSGNTIEELFVDPGHHRQGIATALFRAADADSQHSALTVTTSGFAVPFYKTVGMQVAGTSPVTFGPLQGRELIQLEKRLTQ